MTGEFHGNPAPLQDGDFTRAAQLLRCSEAAVRAVAKVESTGNGFLPDGRVKILFERHKFHRFTGGKFASSHPHLSNPAPGGYLGGYGEHRRLGEAITLAREAALKSASWGAFQIMGFNHQPAGFGDVESLVQAMAAGAGQQLDAFARFVLSQGLDRHLRALDWAAFARGYNGPAYRKNRYDQRMDDAYRRYSGETGKTGTPEPTLRRGCRGQAVARLQSALGVPADGIFGPQTLRAVRRAQARAGLAVDGIAGRRTWQALLAE